MTNDERKYLLEETKRAQANGFEGSVLDVFRNPNILQEFQAQSVLQPTQGSNIEIAATPEQQQQGLRGRSQAELPAQMIFPNVPPNTPFNTMGMKAPINIEKYEYDDDGQGHLVKSYKNVPPGIANLPMGPQRGTVIETPAAQSGGIIQPKGDPWEYQYKDGKYLTRRRGSENWITARGNALEAIKTKVYKLPPTTQPPSRSAQQPRRQEERPERKVEIPAALDRTRVNSTQTSDNIELIPGLNLNTPAPRPRQQPARQEPTTSSDRVRSERLPRFDIGVRPNVAQADNTRTSPFPTPTRALNQPEIDELGRPLALRREAERRAQETPGEIRPASQNYRPKIEPSWLERTINEASDAAAEWIDEKASGAKRVAGRILPADEESLIDVPEENIVIPTVENESVPVQETFKELARYPDEIKGNELSSFVHTFDNIEGGTYRVGPKVKELYSGWNKRRGAITTMSGAAVAHFLRDSDVSENQQFAPESWEIGRNNYEMKNMSKEGKLIGYTQKQMNDPERYRMMYRKNEDGTYSIKYKKLKDIGEGDAEWSYDLPVSRQHRFSDIDWDKKGKSTGYQALGGRTYFIPLKPDAKDIDSEKGIAIDEETGLNHTSIPVGKGNEFSRFSGGSVVFLFTDPKTGREIGIDVSGSKDVLRDTGRKLIEQYGLKEEDITVAYHDMGSYSAKPASKNGKLDYDQWINFNAYNRGFSGAPLIIANQQAGGIKKYKLGGVRKYQSGTPSPNLTALAQANPGNNYFNDINLGPAGASSKADVEDAIQFYYNNNGQTQFAVRTGYDKGGNSLYRTTDLSGLEKTVNSIEDENLRMAALGNMPGPLSYNKGYANLDLSPAARRSLGKESYFGDFGTEGDRQDIGSWGAFMGTMNYLDVDPKTLKMQPISTVKVGPRSSKTADCTPTLKGKMPESCKLKNSWASGGVRKYQSAGLKLTPSDFEFTTDRTRGNARYFTDPKTGEPFPLVNLPEATVSAERTPYSQISNNSRLAGAYQAKPWFEAAGDNPDSPYFKMGQRIMNERIDDLNTAAFAYEFTGIPGFTRTIDRLQNNPADIFTLEGGLDALSLLGPVAIGSKATNVLKPASNARKFLPKQTFLTTTSSADDVGKGFKSEIDWRNWVKYAEDFDNNPDVVQNLLDIERKTKADGTWMKNSDGSPFQGTPEEFVIQQSDRFKKAYEQGYNEVYRGISRRENNAVNLDPDFTAATKRFPKGDRAIFGADYDLAKRYVKDIDPETGDFFTPDNPTILGSKDTGPGVYKLIYPKGKEVEFNAMGDFWGELNLNRSQTKSAINNTLAEKIEAFKRVEKYLGPKNALDLKKVIKNLEEAAQTAADSEKVLDPNLEKIRKTFPGLTTTDDLAKYIEGTDLSNIKLKNVDDGGVGDVDIINNAKGRYLKSKRGNILFDLNNPNVYKALVPAAVGAGTAAAAGSGPKEIIPPDFRYGGPISYAPGGLPGEMLYRSTSAGAPLAYDSPTANGYLLPDPNRPELMNTGATEYKMGVDNDLIPTVVNGMYFNPEDAYQRYRLTGEKFKPTADPSAYSKFYDEVNKLGIMKQKRSGGKKPKYKAPKMY